jgi:hypothetical protein
MGTMVGGLIIVTNTRTLLLWAGMSGPTRLAVLFGLVAVAGVLVARSALIARSERLVIDTPVAQPVPAAAT